MEDFCKCNGNCRCRLLSWCSTNGCPNESSSKIFVEPGVQAPLCNVCIQKVFEGDYDVRDLVEVYYGF